MEQAFKILKQSCPTPAAEVVYEKPISDLVSDEALLLFGARSQRVKWFFLPFGSGTAQIVPKRDCRPWVEYHPDDHRFRDFGMFVDFQRISDIDPHKQKEVGGREHWRLDLRNLDGGKALCGNFDCSNGEFPWIPAAGVVADITDSTILDAFHRIKSKCPDK